MRISIHKDNFYLQKINSQKPPFSFKLAKLNSALLNISQFLHSSTANKFASAYLSGAECQKPKIINRRDSGCGSVGRAVTSDTRGPRFESNHLLTFI